MAVQVRMPALGESVTEGTVTRWLKQEGDLIQEGEGLLEVATDKVDTEIPSPVTGVVTSILAAEDDTVPVGGDLAVVDDTTDAAAPSAAQPSSAPSVGATSSRSPQPAPTPAADTNGSGRDVVPQGVFATPSVVAFARQHGVQLESLAGSGPAGRIRRQDVRRAAGLSAWAPLVPATAPGSLPPAFTSPVGRSAVIADRPQSEAVRTPPAAPAPADISARRASDTATAAGMLLRELDVTAVEDLCRREGPAFERREGVPLSLRVFVIRAIVDALRTVPSLVGGGKLDVEVDTPGGKLRVDDVGGLGLAGTARRISTNTGHDLAGVTLIEAEGAAVEVPKLIEGQPVAVGIGGVVRRPIVVTTSGGIEALGVGAMAQMALVYDVSTVTRRDAARLLSGIADRLRDGHFEVRTNT